MSATNNELSIIDKKETAERFAKIFSGVHNVDIARAAQMFEVEKFSFVRFLEEKAIEGVTDLSKMGVFLDVISNGLSFSGQMTHVYMMSKNVKTGRKEGGKDVYEKRLVYQTAPDGKIYLAQKAGSIDRVTKPVIVYDCDEWGVSDTGGKIKLHYVKSAHRPPDAKIIAGFIYVIFPNDIREPFYMDMDDIDRLKLYSARNNRKWDGTKFVTGDPNALYTSHKGQIDPGFFASKLINFSMKNIRRAGLSSPNEVDDVEFEYVPDTPSAEFEPDPVPPEVIDETNNEENKDSF